jgi:hypothetical protein
MNGQQAQAKLDKESLKRAEAGFLQDLTLDLRKTANTLYSEAKAQQMRHLLSITLMRIFHAEGLTQDQTWQMITVGPAPMRDHLTLCKADLALPKGRVGNRLAIALAELGFTSNTRESTVYLTGPDYIVP